jgi:hypothetical protein
MNYFAFASSTPKNKRYSPNGKWVDNCCCIVSTTIGTYPTREEYEPVTIGDSPQNRKQCARHFQ